MSMTTRCPDCSTLFKVVADQLRMSEGWVRCGKCGLVFDGQAHLEDGRSEVVESAVKPDTGLSTPPPQPVAADMPEQSTTGETFVSQTESWGESDDAVAPEESLREPAAPDPAPEVTFVKVAKRKALWRNPWMRALLATVAFLLSCMLLAQGAIHERHRLVAEFPQVRPWVQDICLPLGCRLDPPPMLEAIVVESSAFNRLRGEQYRLVIQVRNAAGVEVAMPSVELTLKDARDDVLLRRVLRPEDFTPAVQGLPAHGEWMGKTVVQITEAALAGRVANFSTLAFYP